MKCSIVMSTRNKAKELNQTLKSIRNQKVPFEYEVIVIDDGSTDETEYVCVKNKVEWYQYLENPIYRNPAYARNVGYKKATGDVIIAQSDDVIHFSQDCIEKLTLSLEENQFIIATVWNYDTQRNKKIMQYTGLQNKRPFFFLGSLWRKDLYAVGGNDEEFIEPGYDDDWFGDCLLKGLGLTCVYRPDIEGHHQDHGRPANFLDRHKISKAQYEEKVRKAQDGIIPWRASGGAWEWKKQE